MPIGYIYLPLGTPEFMEFANDWNQGRRDKNKPEHVVISNSSSGFLKVTRRVLGFGMLKVVGTLDKLYVLTHGGGMKGSARIGGKRKRQLDTTITYKTVWKGGTPKSWDAAEFAAHLEAEGLNKGHRDLRIFACGSGIEQTVDNESYTQRLAKALFARGYHQIVVTGYLGNLRYSYSHRQTESTKSGYTKTKHKGVELENHHTEPAHDHRVSYDGSGTLLSGPPQLE